MSIYIGVQKRYSSEERAGILADYQASGLTQREFVARAGISLACLSIWLRRQKLGHTPKKVSDSSVAFVPVQLKEQSTASPAVGGSVEIELPGSMVVRLPGSYSPAEAVQFILQLRRAC